MFSDIATLIKKNEKILIYPHISADGDCLGSAFALKLALVKMGKQAEVKLEPSDEGNRVMAVIKDVSQESFSPDLIIAVDCGDTLRLGSRRDSFVAFENTVNIDHHGTNDGYARVNYVNAKAAATGEIVFELLEFLKVQIDDAIANNLYVALSSDTGGFAYSNTTKNTHRVAGELVQYNIDFPYINAYLFRTNTKKELMLIKEALKTLEVIAEGKIASVTTTMDIIERYQATNSDLGGIVDYPRSLDTVEIALYFKEQKNGVKVSMRSTGPDVSAIAVKHGGGGHIRAAACVIEKPLLEVKKIIYEDAISVIGG